MNDRDNLYKRAADALNRATEDEDMAGHDSLAIIRRALDDTRSAAFAEAMELLDGLMDMKALEMSEDAGAKLVSIYGELRSRRYKC